MNRKRVVRILVGHAYYGCDTGCCGHVATVEFNDGTAYEGQFEFSHPYGDDVRAWARKLVEGSVDKTHLADLDWDNALVLEDISED